MTVSSAQIKKHTPTVLAYIARYIILCCFAYVLVYPFVYMAINTIKSPGDWFDPTVFWVPKSLSTQSVREAVKAIDFWQCLGNTVIFGLIPAIISTFTCAIAGYGMARFKFKGKSVLSFLMILCILIPEPLIMIASYENFSHLDILGFFGLINQASGVDVRLNLIDSPFVFILPALLSIGLKSGLFIYIYTQFYKGLPKELEEAAWIDGAGPWRTFLNIVLPSSGTSSITVLVFSTVWYWNDYYEAGLYLTDHKTLSVQLYEFDSLPLVISGLKLTRGSLLLASCFLSILPLLLFFLIIQKRFVQSIATCGIVG